MSVVVVFVAFLALCSVIPVTLSVLNTTVSLKFSNNTPRFRFNVNDSKTTDMSSGMNVVTFKAEPSRYPVCRIFPAKSAIAPGPMVM